MLWVSAALAQAVPEGDFESSGEYIGWTLETGSASNVYEWDSSLQDSWVLDINRANSAIVVCSSPFVQTRLDVIAKMHAPNGGSTDWSFEDGGGNTLVVETESPSVDTDPFSSETLHGDTVCGLEVRVCLAPHQDDEIEYDEFELDNDPCPQFDDVDDDGVCPEGIDLDGLDGCTAADEIFVDYDCDDANPYVFPGQLESCNGADDNCDLVVDEGFDVDTDGYTSCGGDCDDLVAEVRPDALEICNHVDDNCDLAVDEGFDGDGDGIFVCDGDCDDGDPAAGAGVPADWFPDFDLDGYGDEGAAPIHACVGPDGAVADGTDCDDRDAEVHPTATDDPGDGVDNDCDGSDAPAGTGAGVDGGVDRTGAAAAEVPVGCGCASGGDAGRTWVAFLVTLFGAARRRRT